MTLENEMGNLASTEGSHLVLAAFVAFAIYQMRALLGKVLQLQERITEVHSRVDQLEAGRLDPMAERMTEIQDRLAGLHCTPVHVPEVQQDQL